MRILNNKNKLNKLILKLFKRVGDTEFLRDINILVIAINNDYDKNVIRFLIPESPNWEEDQILSKIKDPLKLIKLNIKLGKPVIEKLYNENKLDEFIDIIKNSIIHTVTIDSVTWLISKGYNKEWIGRFILLNYDNSELEPKEKDYIEQLYNPDNGIMFHTNKINHYITNFLLKTESKYDITECIINKINDIELKILNNHLI